MTAAPPMPHTLLTIDVWDTVLRRACYPDEVKLYVARALLLGFGKWIGPEHAAPVPLLHLRQLCEHEIGQERLAAGADDEYRLDDVLARWARRAMIEVEPHFLGMVVEHLRQVELAQEHRVTYADPGFDGLLRSIRSDRVVALSDFYLPASELARLIEIKQPRLKLDEVLVSCDLSLNKRSGRLFTHVHREFGVEPAQHIHVGDNHVVDVQVPSSLGIQAVHYHDAPQEGARAFHRDRWSQRHADVMALRPMLDAELRAAATIPQGLTADQREIFIAGVRAAPLCVGMVLRAIEEALRQGVPRVHYFTREGVFFQRIHHALALASPGDSLLGVPLPEAELLEVSRLATFVGSIQAPTPREFMRLWNLYSTQSMKGMLTSLGISRLAAAPLLKLHHLSPDEPVRFPWQDPRVLSLFADRKFGRLIERQRDAKRQLLQRYLATKGIADDGTPKVIVDIGWRGTIQDNLAHVMPGSPIIGVYMGMHALLNVQPSNARKIAYAADVGADLHRYGRTLQNVQPLEMLCNSPEGSVAGYEPDTTPGAPIGAMRAIRTPDPEETASFERCARFFQDGVIAGVPVLARWIRDYAMSADDLAPLAFEALRTIIADPPLPMAKAFFALNHNETFGLGGFVEMRAHAPERLAKRAERDAGALAELEQAAEESFWPCAFYRVHRLEPYRERFAREKLHAQPILDLHATDPVAAARALAHVESSRSWRWINRAKRLWPLGAISRMRHGPSSMVGPSDPVERLHWITNSRAFKLVAALKAAGPIAWYSRRRHGLVERW